jgi:hypothetical protein
MARRVWRLGGDNAIMAVCAHAQTAIFFFGAKWSETRVRTSRRQNRVVSVTVVVRPAANFADLCAIFIFLRLLPGSHDARL